MLLFVLLVLLGVFITCLVGNALVVSMVRSEAGQRRLAVLVVPLLPAVILFAWIYPGLMPWNAAGVVAFYPLLHAIFVVASAASFAFLEYVRSLSPPPS